MYHCYPLAGSPSLLEFCDHVASIWDHSVTVGRGEELGHNAKKPQITDVMAANEEKKLGVELNGGEMFRYIKEKMQVRSIYVMIPAMLATIHGEKMNAKVLELHQKEKKMEKPICLR